MSPNVIPKPKPIKLPYIPASSETSIKWLSSFLKRRSPPPLSIGGTSQSLSRRTLLLFYANVVIGIKLLFKI